MNCETPTHFSDELIPLYSLALKQQTEMRYISFFSDPVNSYTPSSDTISAMI